MPFIIRNKNIYNLGVGISTISEIYCRSWSEGGGACPPGESKGTQGLCVWMPFIIRNKNIYGLGVVTWTVCKILGILTFSPYKCLCYQIWPWPKIGQDHTRVIIWTNYDGPIPRCYILSFVEIGPAVPEKKIFGGFLPYMGMAAILVMWLGPRE